MTSAARKTDEQIASEYLAHHRQVPADDLYWRALLRLVASCRKVEPRINSGSHLLDYLNICDEDDTMDTFYGADYFTKYPD